MIRLHCLPALNTKRCYLSTPQKALSVFLVSVDILKARQSKWLCLTRSLGLENALWTLKGDTCLRRRVFLFKYYGSVFYPTLNYIRFLKVGSEGCVTANNAISLTSLKMKNDHFSHSTFPFTDVVG